MNYISVSIQFFLLYSLNAFCCAMLIFLAKSKYKEQYIPQSNYKVKCMQKKAKPIAILVN